MGWQQRFSIGIPEIDAQHQSIVRGVSRLQHVTGGGHDRADVNRALAELLGHYEKHTAAEEALMRSAKYPFLDVHIIEHRYLVEYLVDLRWKSLSADIGRHLAEFVDAWLSKHVMVCDRHFASWRVGDSVPFSTGSECIEATREDAGAAIRNAQAAAASPAHKRR